MMSALSNVFEHSSQERASADTRENDSEDWQSARGRPSGEQRRSADTQESSSSDHGYELREVRFVQPPDELKDVLEESRRSDEFPSASKDATARQGASKFTSPFERTQLFDDYRTRLERPARGPAASSSREAHSLFTQQPKDSLEIKRNAPLRSAMRPSTEMSMTSAASIPADADPSAFVVQAALTKAAEENSERKSFQALRLGSLGQRLTSIGPTRHSSIPQRVRVSLDNVDVNQRDSAVNSVTATLVRKRRRLPWKLMLAFGIVSCLCLMVALTTLSIGIYNFTKLRAARAARTIDQLRNEIEPQIAEILRILQTTRRFLR